MATIRPISNVGPDLHEVPEDLFEEAVTLLPIRCGTTLGCGHTFSASTLTEQHTKTCSICRAPFFEASVHKDMKLDGFIRAHVSTESTSDEVTLISNQKFTLLYGDGVRLGLINVERDGEILEVHVARAPHNTFKIHILVNPANSVGMGEKIRELERKGIFFDRDSARTQKRPKLEDFDYRDAENIPYGTGQCFIEFAYDDAAFIKHAVQCLYFRGRSQPEPRLFQLRTSRINQIYLVCTVTADTFYELLFQNNFLDKKAFKALKSLVPPQNHLRTENFLACEVCKRPHLLTNPHILSRCGHIADLSCVTPANLAGLDVFYCRKKTCRRLGPSKFTQHVLYGKVLETLKPKKPYTVLCGSNHKKTNSKARLRSATPTVGSTSFSREVPYLDTTNFFNMTDTPQRSRFGDRFTKKPKELSMLTFSSFEGASYIRQIHVLSDLKKHYVLIVRFQETDFTQTLYDLKKLKIKYKQSPDLPRNYILFTHNDHDTTKKFFRMIEEHLDINDDKLRLLREYACLDYQESKLTRLFQSLSM